MKHLYLLLAIAGAVLPWLFFADFFLEEGMALEVFVAGLFVNGAAGGFATDVLLSSCVFWIYLFNTNTPRVWLYIVVNLSIGLSCALPLYLYVNELEKQRQAAG